MVWRRLSGLSLEFLFGLPHAVAYREGFFDVAFGSRIELGLEEGFVASHCGILVRVGFHFGVDVESEEAFHGVEDVVLLVLTDAMVRCVEEAACRACIIDLLGKGSSIFQLWGVDVRDVDGRNAREAAGRVGTFVDLSEGGLRAGVEVDHLDEVDECHSLDVTFHTRPTSSSLTPDCFIVVSVAMLSVRLQSCFRSELGVVRGHQCLREVSPLCDHRPSCPIAHHSTE